MPPRNIRPTNPIWRPETQLAKSAVAYPVVVMIDTLLKVAVRTASSTPTFPRLRSRPVSKIPTSTSPMATTQRVA